MQKGNFYTQPQWAFSLSMDKLLSLTRPQSSFESVVSLGGNHGKEEAEPFLLPIILRVLQFSHKRRLETSQLLSLTLVQVENKATCIKISGVIPYEQVVAELAADTLDQVSCLGLRGSRFMPEEFPQLACVSLKVSSKSELCLNLTFSFLIVCKQARSLGSFLVYIHH